ncbi:VWA domain-containing protein [Natroniella sulfidigena]|uniref:vWA domain-containing protein n=1 Tax=Natroniella sulfidigena TaxID=723921 RepID=UPI00200A7D53|nr:vWA domain-containing protein [Natroniella sulfidigena]MCK8817302.1 VWA domain-containing protein [Natroniella sulfidigena]
MKLQQNLILIFLIFILLSAILSLNTLNIISTSPINEENAELGREIKVNSDYISNNRVNVKIIWDVISEEEEYIETSKEVLTTIINDFPEDVYLGMRVFGTINQITDNSLLRFPLTIDNQENLINFIKEVEPANANTSTSKLNLIKTADSLIDRQGKKHILLITNNNDNQQKELINTVEKLTRKGIRTHVIHTGNINDSNQPQLKSLAESGNGKYFTYFEKDRVVPTINLN